MLTVAWRGGVFEIIGLIISYLGGRAWVAQTAAFCVTMHLGSVNAYLCLSQTPWKEPWGRLAILKHRMGEEHVSLKHLYSEKF